MAGLREVVSRSAYERRNEKNKAAVRWFLVLLIGGYLAYLLSSGQTEGIDSSGNAAGLFNWVYIGAVTGFFAGLNLLFSLYLYFTSGEKRTLHPGFKYLTTFFDFLAVSFVVLPTGGSESMLFVIYFVVIVSNGLRYGMRLALFGVLCFNLLYVLLLAFQYYPELTLPNMQREVLKVFGFWLVGLYIGYLARRYELLQGEVEKYRLLVEKLMARRAGS